MNSWNSQSLERFVDAQKTVYDTAIAELKSGQKRSHWIWFIFPHMQYRVARVHVGRILFWTVHINSTIFMQQL